MSKSTSQSTLEARNLTKGFTHQQVLNGIDLTVSEGEILMLMGPNGAGKSVFASCLAGSSEPDEGEIRLLGEKTPIEARASISAMVQGQMAVPDLTGRENLRFYSDLHPHGTDEWTEFIDRLELADDLDRPVRQYSGGMVRKLEVAITLSADVPLYMFDEPTAEMDLAIIRELHNIFIELQSAGKTLLVTSHAPIDTQIADRIAFLRDGQIVADGKPGELLDELPRVLRVRGAVPEEKQLLGDRMFQRGDEIRGFLSANIDVNEMEAEHNGGGNSIVEIDPPSYTDLFNYYTYISRN